MGDINFKKVVEICKEYDYKVSKQRLYSIGFTRGFMHKTEDDYHVLFDEDKLREWLNTTRDAIPNGYMKISDLSKEYNVVLLKAYKVAKLLMSEGKARYIGVGRGVLYADKESFIDVINHNFYRTPEDYISVNELCKKYKISKTVAYSILKSTRDTNKVKIPNSASRFYIDEKLAVSKIKEWKKYVVDKIPDGYICVADVIKDYGFSPYKVYTIVNKIYETEKPKIKVLNNKGRAIKYVKREDVEMFIGANRKLCDECKEK